MKSGGNGVFKTNKGFTVVYNTAARDPRLSEKALGLYTRIASYITMPDGQITKSRIMGWCSCGAKAFEGAWQELKECGYLLQRMQSGAGREWRVEYELLATPREDGVHTFYLNAAGEVTKTNLTRGTGVQSGSQRIASKEGRDNVTPKTGITSQKVQNTGCRRYPQNGHHVNGNNINGGDNINTSINKTNSNKTNLNLHPLQEESINAARHTGRGNTLSDWYRNHPPDEETDEVIMQVIQAVKGKEKVNIGSRHAPCWVSASDAWDKICSLTQQQVRDYMRQLKGYDRPISSPGRFHLVGLCNQAGGFSHKPPDRLGTKFNNFEQRCYSREEFDDLERMLNSI